MRLKPEQLSASLSKGLAPVYFFSSDEPLQLGEMADTVRTTAKAAGFAHREILSVDSSFQWHELTVASDSLSIFSDKKVIDLRLESALPNAEGAKVLCSLCERIQADNLLLITSGQLKKEALKSRWFQALDKVGIIVQAWPLEGQDLLQWLQKRLQQRDLQVDPEGLRVLASRVEGNLLAAAREVEKLYVLYGSGHFINQQIFDVVADSSRYDVFKLMDCVLSGDVNRVFKVFLGLQAEGIAAPVVLWVITRELRNLLKINQAFAQGQSKDLVFRNHQIWDKRKQLVNKALARLGSRDLQSMLSMSAQADRQIKGQQLGDAWESLLQICLRLASGLTLVNAC